MKENRTKKEMEKDIRTFERVNIIKEGKDFLGYFEGGYISIITRILAGVSLIYYMGERFSVKAIELAKDNSNIIEFFNNHIIYIFQMLTGLWIVVWLITPVLVYIIGFLIEMLRIAIIYDLKRRTKWKKK